MDYGKLAMLKIEDIERLLKGREKAGGGLRMIAFELEGDFFTGNFFTREAAFSSGETTLCADVSFFSEGSCEAEVSVMLDGVPFGERRGQIGGHCLLSFMGDIPKGKHRLRVMIKAEGDAPGAISGVNVRLWGDVAYEDFDGKLVALRHDGFVRVAYCDSENVCLAVYYGGQLITSDTFARRGDFSFCPLPHENGGVYDFLYFFCDEGKLYMHVLPYFSPFSAYRQIIDEGVSKVCCAASENPRGALLYYLKGGSVHIRHVALEDGVVRVSQAFEQVPLPKAYQISAAQGLEKGAGFAVSEKGGRNCLYLSNCGFKSFPKDAVRADIICRIEGLS